MRMLRRLLVVLAVAVISAGAIVGTIEANQLTVRHTCFVVNYVDVRGGYAPVPSLYTSIGTVYGGIDRGEASRATEVGEFLEGETWCGNLYSALGAYYGPWVYFADGRVVSYKQPNPVSPVVNS